MLDGGSIGFDDNGQPVPTVGPDYGDADAPPAAGEAEARAEAAAAVRGLLDALCSGDAPPAQVGRRAILLRWLLCRDCSQAALAEKVGVSPGRVSQILNTFSAKNRPFSAFFGQAAKQPPHS